MVQGQQKPTIPRIILTMLFRQYTLPSKAWSVFALGPRNSPPKRTIALWKSYVEAIPALVEFVNLDPKGREEWLQERGSGAGAASNLDALRAYLREKDNE
jgi:hypothetical protein